MLKYGVLALVIGGLVAFIEYHANIIFPEKNTHRVCMVSDTNNIFFSSNMISEASEIDLINLGILECNVATQSPCFVIHCDLMTEEELKALRNATEQNGSSVSDNRYNRL
jgi:hypothetical protein